MVNFIHCFVDLLNNLPNFFINAASVNIFKTVKFFCKEFEKFTFGKLIK